MADTAYTKGPWIVYDGIGGWIIQRGASGGFVVQDRDEYRAQADACLISAAPELLEALKALSASIFVPNDDRSPELSTALEMTVSAIAKAEGRS